MAKDRDQILQDLVNASGFVFQLGLEHAVRETEPTHGWRVLSREHPWMVGERTGFADLVIGQGIVRLVVECKRPRDGTWVFLVPQAAAPVKRFRCQWTSHAPNKRDLLGWADFVLTPDSLESDFCIIRGQGEGDRSMLERVVAGLLDSLPPVAIEEAKLRANDTLSTELIHIPIVVTTAALEVCRYSPNEIDLAQGTLENPRFERVDFLRFRKSLAHEVGEWGHPSEIGAVARDKERSVIVCSAEHFPDFLKRVNIDAVGGFFNAPWVAARQWEEKHSSVSGREHG
jgi:hypothetical protein